MATNGINPAALNRVESLPASNARQKLPPKGNDVPLNEGPPPAESREEINKAVSEINLHVQSLNRDLQFSVDEELGGLGRTVVKVLDSETKEVIRQIPSEEVLKIARQLKDMIETNSSTEGLFFKEQV